MNAYLISYNLKHPDSIKNPDAIGAAIKGITGWWWHHIPNVWIVAGDSLTAKEVYAKLKPVLNLTGVVTDDTVFIVKIVPTERSGWLPKKAWDWLKKISD